MPEEKIRSSGAFTLIELLVVITIISILSIGLMKLDFNHISAKEKRNQFGQTIVSIVRGETMRNISGKSLSGNSGNHPTLTRIAISKNGVSTLYYSGSVIFWTGTVLAVPFFGDSHYEIRSLSFTGANTVPYVLSDETAIIDLIRGKDTNLYYSWASSGSGTELDIEIAYMSGASQILRFDRRTNRMEVQ